MSVIIDSPVASCTLALSRPAAAGPILQHHREPDCGAQRRRPNQAACFMIASDPLHMYSEFRTVVLYLYIAGWILGALTSLALASRSLSVGSIWQARKLASTSTPMAGTTTTIIIIISHRRALSKVGGGVGVVRRLIHRIKARLRSIAD